MLKDVSRVPGPAGLPVCAGPCRLEHYSDSMRRPAPRAFGAEPAVRSRRSTTISGMPPTRDPTTGGRRPSPPASRCRAARRATARRRCRRPESAGGVGPKPEELNASPRPRLRHAALRLRGARRRRPSSRRRARRTSPGRRAARQGPCRVDKVPDALDLRDLAGHDDERAVERQRRARPEQAASACGRRPPEARRRVDHLARRRTARGPAASAAAERVRHEERPCKTGPGNQPNPAAVRKADVRDGRNAEAIGCIAGGLGKLGASLR